MDVDMLTANTTALTFSGEDRTWFSKFGHNPQTSCTHTARPREIGTG